MQEFDENKAVALMSAVIPAELRDEDDVFEVLDLIFDFYEDNGQLDINASDDDDDFSVGDVVAYIRKITAKRPLPFSDKQLAAMVEAELEYEDSLL